MGSASASLANTALSSGISAGVGLATAAAGMWMNSIQTSHNADTATTLIVNGLAQQLQNLDNAYLGEPSPSCADQRAALDAYDAAWLWLQSPAACGAPSYGSAGNRCISDRAPGGPYPWQTYYRDPIANDPRVASCANSSQEVFLPSLTTGNYQATGITAQGTPDVPAAVTAAPAPAEAMTTNPAAASVTAAGLLSTNLLPYAALGLGALFLLR